MSWPMEVPTPQGRPERRVLFTTVDPSENPTAELGWLAPAQVAIPTVDDSENRIAELAEGLRAEARTLNAERDNELDRDRWDLWTRRIHALEAAADLLACTIGDDAPTRSDGREHRIGFAT